MFYFRIWGFFLKEYNPHELSLCKTFLRCSFRGINAFGVYCWALSTTRVYIVGPCQRLVCILLGPVNDSCVYCWALSRTRVMFETKCLLLLSIIIGLLFDKIRIFPLRCSYITRTSIKCRYMHGMKERVFVLKVLVSCAFGDSVTVDLFWLLQTARSAVWDRQKLWQILDRTPTQAEPVSSTEALRGGL